MRRKLIELKCWEQKVKRIKFWEWHEGDAGHYVKSSKGSFGIAYSGGFAESHDSGGGGRGGSSKKATESSNGKSVGGNNEYHIDNYTDSEGKTHVVIKDSKGNIVAFTNSKDAPKLLEKFRSGELKPESVVYTKDESSGKWYGAKIEGSDYKGITQNDIIYINKRLRSTFVDLDKTKVVTEDSSGKKITMTAKEFAKSTEPINIGNKTILVPQKYYNPIYEPLMKNNAKKISIDTPKVEKTTLNDFFKIESPRTQKIPQEKVAPIALLDDISKNKSVLDVLTQKHPDINDLVNIAFKRAVAGEYFPVATKVETRYEKTMQPVRKEQQQLFSKIESDKYLSVGVHLPDIAYRDVSKGLEKIGVPKSAAEFAGGVASGIASIPAGITILGAGLGESLIRKSPEPIYAATEGILEGTANVLEVPLRQITGLGGKPTAREWGEFASMFIPTEIKGLKGLKETKATKLTLTASDFKYEPTMKTPKPIDITHINFSELLKTQQTPVEKPNIKVLQIDDKSGRVKQWILTKDEGKISFAGEIYDLSKFKPVKTVFEFEVKKGQKPVLKKFKQTEYITGEGYEKAMKKLEEKEKSDLLLYSSYRHDYAPKLFYTGDADISPVKPKKALEKPGIKPFAKPGIIKKGDVIDLSKIDFRKIKETDIGGFNEIVEKPVGPTLKPTQQRGKVFTFKDIQEKFGKERGGVAQKAGQGLLQLEKTKTKAKTKFKTKTKSIEKLFEAEKEKTKVSQKNREKLKLLEKEKTGESTRLRLFPTTKVKLRMFGKEVGLKMFSGEFSGEKIKTRIGSIEKMGLAKTIGIGTIKGLKTFTSESIASSKSTASQKVSINEINEIISAVSTTDFLRLKTKPKKSVKYINDLDTKISKKKFKQFGKIGDIKL